MKVSSARARQAILVNDGIPMDPGHPPDHIALFDEDGNRIYFTGTHGIPPGGRAGQVLAKASDDDYDVHWVDAVAVDPGGGGSDPASAYTMPGYTPATDGTHTPVDVPVTGVKLSEFPYSFDTTAKPLHNDQEAPMVAIWFRVTAPGVVSFDGVSANASDNYGFLYHAADPVTPITQDDDHAGNSQPRITATVDVGDYILVYTGYDATQFGQGTWNLNATTTATLAEDLSGAAPQPPLPPLPGPDLTFSVQSVGVLQAEGYNGPWVQDSGDSAWEVGRWLEVATDGTLNIARSNYCTLAIYREMDQSWNTAVGLNNWNFPVYAGQKLAVFCSEPNTHLSIILMDGATFAETLFNPAGGWDETIAYNRDDVVLDNSLYWRMMRQETVSGPPAPSAEVDPDYTMMPPVDSQAYNVVADHLAHRMFSASDLRGAYQVESLGDGSPKLFFFELADVDHGGSDTGSVWFADLQKPSEIMQLFDATGTQIHTNMDDGGAGSPGIAGSLAPGIYFLSTQDANGLGTGAQPVAVLGDGALMVPTRTWVQIPNPAV